MSKAFQYDLKRRPFLLTTNSDMDKLPVTIEITCYLHMWST